MIKLYTKPKRNSDGISCKSISQTEHYMNNDDGRQKCCMVPNTMKRLLKVLSFTLSLVNIDWNGLMKWGKTADEWVDEFWVGNPPPRKRPVERFQKRGLNKLVDIEEIAGRSWQEWKKNSFILADRDGKTSWTIPGGNRRRGPDDNQVQSTYKNRPAINSKSVCGLLAYNLRVSIPFASQFSSGYKYNIMIIVVPPLGI